MIRRKLMRSSYQDEANSTARAVAPASDEGSVENIGTLNDVSNIKCCF